MIDFTNCERNFFKAYGGGNGSKINIRYNGKPYMLKFNPKPDRRVSYANSYASEYLSCHIVQSLGIPAQNTLLGIYRQNGKTYNVVACEDFNQNGYQLMEFAKLKNTCIDSSKNGYGVELQSILDSIDEQKLIEPQKLKEFFWDMFIVDSLLGNFDRHNGNWGVLVNENLQLAQIAPIYDCGSCLYPQLSLQNIPAIISNQEEIEQRIFVFPNSAIKLNDIKINYFDFISSLDNKDCIAALLRIKQKINMEKITDIINSAPLISEQQKEFYITMLNARKERIIDYSWNKYFQLLKDQILALSKQGFSDNEIERKLLPTLPGNSYNEKKQILIFGYKQITK